MGVEGEDRISLIGLDVVMSLANNVKNKDKRIEVLTRQQVHAVASYTYIDSQDPVYSILISMRIIKGSVSWVCS